MNEKLHEIFEKLWTQYCQLNPSAQKIKELLKVGSKNFVNDHVAFRTFQHPRLGVKSLARFFLENGYQFKGEYHFEAKKLYARHLEHVSDRSAPKVFISELKTNQFSLEIQKMVDRIADSLSDAQIEAENFCYSGRNWEMNYSEYQKIYPESEYAAWVGTFGFCANHFTVYINELTQFTGIAELNEFIKSKGYKLNSNEGEIKGSPEVYLEQSSTMAESLEVKFSDGEFAVPACYYEFAKRYPLENGEMYQGFVAKSADKIFESTNKI